MVPGYDEADEGLVRDLERDVSTRLASMPKRLAHSLSVGRCAEGLAMTYGVDPLDARVAGILHDWDKVLPHEELVRRAHGLGIDMGVDLTLVKPLLHGIVAAHELRTTYPWMSDAILQAISRHTTGAVDMTPLDEVVFVADGIEPLRKASPGIDVVRRMVGRVSLDDLFWEAFAGGMAYLIDTRRYLYPGTLDIYNELVLKRSAQKENA
jgi:predicted HD superfamily hydrolase involved in NAD metabolism